MKKLAVCLMVMAMAAMAYAQNGLNQGNLFILPKDDKRISVNIWEKDKIKEIQALDINSKSIYATDQKARVVIVDTAKNTIQLYDLGIQKDTTFSMPFKMKVESILLDDHNLFVGGQIEKELLVQYQIKTNRWYALEAPKEVLHVGKAIDDLVINDSLLIAVDNIVTPKYVLYYRLNQHEKLSFSHYRGLKHNGSYERIHQARITPKYLGLRSDTFSGYSGAGSHITIYGDLDLRTSFSISTVQPNEDYHTFQDFVIVDDMLVVASKDRGLGSLNIDRSYFKEANQNHNELSNVNISIDSLAYANYQGKLIQKLTVIPHTQKVIVTIELEKGKYLHEVIDVRGRQLSYH